MYRTALSAIAKEPRPQGAAFREANGLLAPAWHDNRMLLFVSSLSRVSS